MAKCEKCGEEYPEGTEHTCPVQKGPEAKRSPEENAAEKPQKAENPVQ